MLAGLGLDAFLSRVRGYGRMIESNRGWVLIAVVAFLALLGAALVPNVDSLIAMWRWLPLVLGLLSLAWLALAWWRKVSYETLAPLALALIIADLIAFNAVYNRTYNQTMPLKEFTALPRSLSFFRSQPGIYRLQTHEEIVPVLPVMRESYYPNLSLIHDLPASNGRFPLVPERYTRYVEQMTPHMLDLLGVKFFLIPQVLPVDEASEFYDLEDPFTLNPVGRILSIPPTEVVAVEVESYLSHSVAWSDGYPVAEIRLRGAEGERQKITLRAGWHTAEWAYDRSDVSITVRHRQAPVVRSWPARSGFPPEEHTGYVYSARFQLPSPLTVNTVEVRPLVPFAYLRIERLILVDKAGTRHQLSHLVNMGDHTLAYRSEDVAIYANHDALPRAFVVHSARAISDDVETLRILRDPAFDPRAEVLLAATEGALPEAHNQDAAASATNATLESADQVDLLVYDTCRVVLKVRTAVDGYLVLTDSWYPGWRVLVDGKNSPILRADLIFRAVYLPAGEHTVEFIYNPRSFTIGLGISAAALLLLAGVWGLYWWSSSLSD